MKKIWLFVLIGLLVVSCRSKVVEEGNDTPTPVIAVRSGQPNVVALSELAENPSDYEGDFIQLTGHYKPLPRLICRSDAQPSPATWGLTSDTLLALAGGFDAQLRPLLPTGLTMTIAGHWQHWEGAVGCDAATQPQSIWYLDVTHIISPSPVIQVTLTPGGAPVALADGTTNTGETAVTPSPTQEPDGEETAVSPTPSATNQSTAQPTSASSIPTATPSPTATANGTHIPGVSTTTPTATATNAAAGTPVTATAPPTSQATATPLPGTTPTPIPTQPPNVTATSTPTLNNIAMDMLDPEELYMTFLDANERHQWTFYNEVSNNNLTINIASVNSVDIAISVVSPSGDRIISQNNAGMGQIEIVSGLNLPQEGEYLIEISAANGASGDYGLMIMDDQSFPVTFGIITYNNMVATTFDENSEQLWFFTGGSGDNVTITAVPNSAADIGIDFMGISADSTIAETLASLDDLGDGQTEQLTNYPLPGSGLYTLWLFGSAGGTIETNLTITKN